MTDLRKAAEMALDAMLSEYSTGGENKYSPWDVIEALRQALAQPEQDNETYGYAKRLAEAIWEKHYKKESPHWRPFHDVLGVLTQIDNMTCGLEKAQPEQEPVCDKDPYYCGYVRCQLGKVCKNTAPPKREWVGLTDDDIFYIWEDCKRNIFDFVTPYAQAIEAKLKEKNT